MVTFAPEVEKKFTEFIEKVAETKRKIWSDRSSKEIQEIVKITGLEPEGAKALSKAAERATAECLPAWKKGLDAAWRSTYAQQVDESMTQILDQMDGMADDYASTDWFDYIQPADHQSWTDAIRQTLSTEQFAAWEKESGERKHDVAERIAEFVKPIAGRVEEQYRQPYVQMASEVTRTLALPKDVSKKVEALSDNVGKAAMETWRKRVERVLWNADEPQRKQIFKQGNIYVSMLPKDLAKLRQVWDKGVSSILSAADAQRLSASRNERTTRRTRAWSQLLIAELDKRVAFTSSQRERLRPIVERLVRGNQALHSENPEVSQSGLPLNALYSTGATAAEGEITTILDPLQWKRWQDTCRNRGNDTARSRIVMRNPRLTEEEKQVQTAEPEELEAVLSNYLYEKASAERSRTLYKALLKAEDAARVAALSFEAADRLHTAARGATEQSLNEWRAGLYESIRPYANGGTVEMVTQRLANVQDYRLQRSVTTPPEKQPIWEEAVKKELTAEQNKAWQAEITQRESYRDAAIAVALLEAFERKVQLSQTQQEKLEPMLANILKEYGQDINGMFSSSSGWYLQQYSMFLPFAGIPEKEMKEVLTKEQWESWTGCNEFGNANNYWENIKRMHDQRNKARK